MEIEVDQVASYPGHLPHLAPGITSFGVTDHEGRDFVVSNTTEAKHVPLRLVFIECVTFNEPNQ